MKMDVQSVVVSESHGGETSTGGGAVANLAFGPMSGDDVEEADSGWNGE